MLARLVAPKIPRQPSVPPALPLYKNRRRLTHSESTLLQVLIPRHFNSSTINTYKKPQGGAPARNSKVLQLVTPASRLIQPDRTYHSSLATHHSPLATIPFRITFFAHPHHLTLIESHSCKKQGRGWGGASNLSIPPNYFRIFPQRVNIQRAATSATPFLSCPYFTLSITHGVGEVVAPQWPHASVTVTSFSSRVFRAMNPGCPHPGATGYGPRVVTGHQPRPIRGTPRTLPVPAWSGRLRVIFVLFYSRLTIH